LQKFLLGRYEFRYNLLTDCAEFRKAGSVEAFRPVGKRQTNTFVLEAQLAGFDNCWNEDVTRIVSSEYISDWHPFLDYMGNLPVWDGTDRAAELAARLGGDSFAQNVFRHWLRGMAAQWMGREALCANSLVPVLVSREQGRRKSTFCRELMPPQLRAYYLDKFDISSRSECERKMALFGLINLDEMDRYPERAMATLKNLVQTKDLKFRKAYSSQLNGLPRIASFIATSNRTDLLTDPTGSRRFLCIEVERSIDCSGIDHAQLFAQLKAELLSGKRSWLDGEEERLLQQRNRLFYKIRPEEEAFRRTFMPASEADGDCEELRASCIYEELKRLHPTLMRGMNACGMGRLLASIHMKAHHRSDGNYYRVKRIAPEADTKNIVSDRDTAV